jgi:predicted nucleic acid-binding protein
MAKRTYIDSNLIINAVRPSVDREQRLRALAVLEEPSRTFIVSDYVKMETLPKMRYNKQQKQVEFTEVLFQKSEYIRSSGKIIDKAEELAEQYGLAAMDALHAASAIAAGADELLTFESPTKPFFRIPPEVLKVVSLHSATAE